VGQRASLLEQPVGKGRFAVVDMRDNTEIPNVVEALHAFPKSFYLLNLTIHQDNRRTGMGSIGILFVNSERGVAGGLTSAIDLATGLAQANHRVTVACHPDSELRRRLDARGIAVAPVAIRAELNAWRAVQIARVVRDETPDVVLADRRKDVKLAFAALRLRSGPALVHRHGAPSPLRDSAVYRAVWTRLQGIVVNSAAMQKTLLERTPWLSAVPIDVIPNGKDLGYWQPQPELRANARAEWGIDESTFVVAYHGVLQPRKNVDLLLRACAAMTKPAHALIVGDGPDALTLRSLAASLGLAATFTGLRSDLPRLLSAADVAVHLSDAEGFSNSVIEALACGLPVVASDATSHREQIDDGVNGLLVDASPERIADALESLRDNAGQRRTMALAARYSAVARFGIDRMVELYGQSLLRATKRP
jgi:glycosyltransferase involved in cell wall biosynthesis